MKPLMRLHSIIISITTLLIFYLWDTIDNLSISYPNAKIPIAALISVGIYRVVLLVVKHIVLQIKTIKKWIFGPSFIEGLWVGFFIGHSNKVRYYIETFEQDFDKLIIKGIGFRDSEGYFGSWISHNATIEVERGELTYTYETDAIKNTFINPGLAKFTFLREELNKPPKELIGFSSDLYNSNKLKAYGIKISDKPQINNFEILINKAKKLYQENRSIISLDELEE